MKSTFLGASYVVDWKNTGGVGGDLGEETGVGGTKREEATGVQACMYAHTYSHIGLLVHKCSGLKLKVNI